MPNSRAITTALSTGDYLDGRLRLVDLPGYGFARVSERVRRGWETMMRGYFESRRSLRGLMITVDIRRGIGELDVQMLDWCAALEVPVCILATKADKLSRIERVYSHRQSLAQCRGWLHANLPHAEKIPVASNAEAARLAGVRVSAVLMFVYVASGALAGLGGVLMASQLKSGAPTYGLMYELYVIAAVVVSAIEAEAQAQALMLQGKDHRAFYEAFKEKRAPRFTGE